MARHTMPRFNPARPHVRIDQPAAVGCSCSANNGRTGWATRMATKPGPTSRVSRPYPAATAAVTVHTKPAYRVPGRSLTPNRFTYQAA